MSTALLLEPVSAADAQPAPSQAGLADGAGLARSGTPPLAGLLAHEPHRPPWAVAGVDYAVGVPDDIVLKDPATIAAAGVSVDARRRVVWISGNGVTLDGYDFAGAGGWSIYIQGGANGTVIANSRFRDALNGQPPIHAVRDAGDLSVRYCTLDGGGGAGGGGWALIAYSGSGNFRAEYNLFVDAQSDAIDFDTGPVTTVVRYNVFQNLGTSPGAHPDSVQYVGMHASNSVIDFNTVYQPHPSGMQGIQLDAQVASTIEQTRIENNTVIAMGPGIDMSYLIAVGQSADSHLDGAVVAHNYLDFRGAYGPFYPPTGQELSFIGNIDMATGRAIAAPKGTSASDVTDVTIQQAQGSPGAGATIMVRFDQPVFVTGAPALSLNTGGTARYSSGSGTAALSFSYVAGAGDRSVPSLAATALTLGGGAAITDANGNAAVLSGAAARFPGLAIGRGHPP